MQFPQEWNELTLAELLFISRQLITKYETVYEMPFHILKFIITERASEQNLQLPKKMFRRLSQEDAATNGIALLQFLFDKNDLTNTPQFQVDDAVSPGNSFSTITCGQYEDCEQYFFYYREKNESKYLLKMFARLWPSASSVADEIHEKRLEQIATPEMLFLVYLWFIGCRHLMPLWFPNLFGGGEETGQPDVAAFTKCIHAGAGPENGTREQIRCMPLKEFAYDIELKIIRNKELESKFKT